MTAMQQQGQPIEKSWARKLARYTVYGLIFIIAMQLGQLWMQRDIVRGVAPDFIAQDMQGNIVNLSEYRGQTTLLYFWASWCPVCRMEHAMVTSLAEDYAVLGVALQSGTRQEVSAHMQKEEASYRSVNDPDGVLSAQYGIKGVPAFFILDEQGAIKMVLSGYTFGLSLRFRLWLIDQGHY